METVFAYCIAFAGNVYGTMSIWKQSHLFGRGSFFLL